MADENENSFQEISENELNADPDAALAEEEKAAAAVTEAEEAMGVAEEAGDAGEVEKTEDATEATVSAAAPGAKPPKTKRIQSDKQKEMQGKRDEKLKELRAMYAERFVNIPEKERPKAKAYDAVALIAAKDPAAKLEEIFQRDRKAYNDKKAGIKAPRKTRKVDAAATADAPTGAVAAVAKPKGKTMKKAAAALTALELRAAAEETERKLMEEARKAKEELLRQATEREEREAAKALAAQTAAAAKALAAKTKAAAKEMEQKAKEILAAKIAEMEAAAGNNLKTVYGSKTVPGGLAKGLATLRSEGRNITAKNFIHICRQCKTRKAVGAKKPPTPMKSRAPNNSAVPMNVTGP